MKTTTADKARALSASFAANFSYFAGETVDVTISEHSGNILARCATAAGKDRLLAQNASKGTYKVRTSPDSLAVIFSL